MREVFKELLSEIPMRAKVIFLILFFVFVCLCAWACMFVDDEIKQAQSKSIVAIGGDKVLKVM